MKHLLLILSVVSFGSCNFFAFAPNAIYVIDPSTNTIVNTIEGDLTASWGDVVTDTENEWIFANDRTGNRVIVIDVAQRKVVKRIPVGYKPVHIYYLPWKREIWTHTDEDGEFDIIGETSHQPVFTDIKSHFFYLFSI
jgi:YVTN family beta-propeller protein